MIRFAILIVAAVIATGVSEAMGQSLSVVRPIKINTVITEEDLVVMDVKTPGTITELASAVGLETRKSLYPGRPIEQSDLGPITVIDRNANVVLKYKSGPLEITTDGRALARASIGDRIQVMNSDSRLIVTGRVIDATTVEVSK